VPLEQAERRAGYAARRSLWIRVSGPRSDAALERLVARRFCRQLADPRLREIGVWRQGARELWILLAQPFITPRRSAAAISRLALV
jgi:hypothetical protein